MTRRRVAAVWVCAVAVVLATQLASLVRGTTAYFTDSHPGSIIGSLAKVEPAPVAATVRTQPQTINLPSNGNVTTFVDALAKPHQLSEIDLASLQLCYRDRCIASHGPATLADRQHVAAMFDGTAFAKLVGADRGDLVLVVEGKLVGGGTFSGQHTNRVTGASSTAGVAAGAAAPAPVASPAVSPSPAATLAPSPTDSPTGTQSPAPSDTPSPSPTDAPSPSPTDAPSPSATPSPSSSPSPAAIPTPSASPAATPSPSETATPSPSPTPTPSPTAS